MANEVSLRSFCYRPSFTTEIRQIYILSFEIFYFGGINGDVEAMDHWWIQHVLHPVDQREWFSLSLLCACIVISHLLEENWWANKSITVFLLDLVSGAVVVLIGKGQSSRLLVISE
ncbi:uncharacterized protein LOC130763080 [Actinidia eriantha]|uniref:uncharacterized protein LOC130763080 n=1 Tax=Actinidia eriantha TaxID=165200 RepID=UPI002582D0C2|nr:uncharacterized protein LOC130763080 [Actinidia eriantha]